MFFQGTKFTELRLPEGPSPISWTPVISGHRPDEHFPVVLPEVSRGEQGWPWTAAGLSPVFLDLQVLLSFAR